jgi:hypothetical protein
MSLLNVRAPLRAKGLQFRTAPLPGLADRTDRVSRDDRGHSIPIRPRPRDFAAARSTVQRGKRKVAPLGKLEIGSVIHREPEKTATRSVSPQAWASVWSSMAMSRSARSVRAARRKLASMRPRRTATVKLLSPAARALAQRHLRRPQRQTGAGAAPWSRRCRSRQASPSYRAQDSRTAFVPVGFPFGPDKGAELALLGALADSPDGCAGLLPAVDGRTGTRRATSFPWRVIMTSSPCSTRSSNSPSLFFASKAPTSRDRPPIQTTLA